MNSKKIALSFFGLVLGIIAGLAIVQSDFAHAFLYPKPELPIQQGAPYFAAMIFGIIFAKSGWLMEKTEYTFTFIIVGISIGALSYCLYETGVLNSIISLGIGVITFASMAGFLDSEEIPKGTIVYGRYLAR